MKTALHYVFVLALICSVSAASLAALHQVTKEPIAASRLQVTLAAVATVLPEFDRLADRPALGAALEAPDLPELYAAFQGEAFVGAAIKVTDPDGYGGAVSFMVGIRADGAIHAIQLLEHKETPGLGTKLAEPAFAGQFEGQPAPPDGFRVTRDGGQIVSVTGATISSRTATRSASRAVELFRQYESKLSAAAAAASPTKGGHGG